MQLNIKNDEAHRLAAELARRTGESMARVVTKALRERLDRLERDGSTAGRLAAVREIQENVARALARAKISAPVQADLDLADYDEHGLPR